MSDLTKRPRAYSYLRMSTDLQLKGDSRRRQLELSADYASEHGLELVDGAQLEDIGVSAFKGANITGGALGGFLKAAEAGKIERGSYLLVESLDRISRQEVRKSLKVFLSIIEAGITIVTLTDKRQYTAEKTDEFELIASLIVMSRAHEESRIKSQRVGAAWANKRANVHLRPLTAKCPAWLKLSKDKQGFEVIESRATIVRSIFEDAANGIGSYSTTRRLNQNQVPSFGRSKGWQTSYVAKILTNRAVIGEFHPHKLINGRRQPTGEAIKGYFPAIIDETLFYRAQAGRADRLLQGRGRKGKFFTNLFSRMATCAYCKSPMTFENKGAGPKGGKFLVCEGAKRGFGCSTVRWRYDDFESSFLAFVQELDLERLLQNENQTSKRAEVETAISTISGELVATKELMDKTYDLYAKAGAAADFVGKKLDDLKIRSFELERALRSKEQEHAALDSSLSGFYESKDRIKALIDRLRDGKSDELYELRAQIASTIKNLVSNVTIAFDGVIRIRRVKSNLVAEHNQHLDRFAQPLREIDIPRPAPRRYFGVEFKNGNVRAIYPDNNDPLQFAVQYIKNAKGFFRLDKTGEQTPEPE